MASVLMRPPTPGFWTRETEHTTGRGETMVHIRTTDPTAVLEQAATDFVILRPRLFRVAYRIVGSSSEAEDIVQEVWLRWQVTDRTVVDDPSAFLARTSARLAINVVQSARSRREAHVGPW